MSIHESGEMYLETILMLTKKNGHVRSVDVSEEMGYSKPSVSRAVSILRDGNYLIMEQDGSLVLTESGLEIAEKILERHTILTQMLIELGVNPEVAAEDACKIEHVISDETFEALKNFLEKQT